MEKLDDSGVGRHLTLRGAFPTTYCEASQAKAEKGDGGRTRDASAGRVCAVSVTGELVINGGYRAIVSACISERSIVPADTPITDVVEYIVCLWRAAHDYPDECTVHESKADLRVSCFGLRYHIRVRR